MLGLIPTLPELLLAKEERPKASSRPPASAAPSTTRASLYPFRQAAQPGHIVSHPMTQSKTFALRLKPLQRGIGSPLRLQRRHLLLAGLQLRSKLLELLLQLRLGLRGDEKQSKTIPKRFLKPCRPWLRSRCPAHPDRSNVPTGSGLSSRSPSLLRSAFKVF